MTLQLQSVPTRLGSLSSKLGHDVDIQTSINGISTKANTAASSFKSTMTNEGSKVLAQKALLTMSLSPNDVRITNMQSALKAATNALTANRQQIVSLQTDIHSNIEICRGREARHRTELSGKQSKIASLRSEIESQEGSIKAHEDEANTVENGAAELDRRAGEVRHAAKRKRKRAGLGGIIGGIVGIAFAPFTGGASLALATAAAGINAGININDAGECERNARRLRDEAAAKRNQAQDLRSKKASLESQKSSLESEIGQLQSSTEKLSEASRGLQEVTNFLRSSITDIDNVLIVFQKMETGMVEASLQTNSFEIIQNAFAANPERLDSRAQVYLNQLKDKWTQVETVLLQHGAKCIA